MGQARHSDTIEAPAAAVWDLVRWDNERALLDSGAFARVEYEERRPVAGACRRLHPHEGAPVRERLESVDAGAMSYVYRVLEPGPMPLKEYVGTVRVNAAGERRCRLEVSCTFEADGVSDEEWAAQYGRMQRGLFEYLRAALAG